LFDFIAVDKAERVVDAFVEELDSTALAVKRHPGGDFSRTNPPFPSVDV
jgi:hypothetical protein